MHIRPDVWCIMNAIFSGVIADAAITRSPSFSRAGESSTIKKFPSPKRIQHVKMYFIHIQIYLFMYRYTAALHKIFGYSRHNY